MRWRAFPLHPDTPMEGMTLEELFRKKGMPADVGQVVDQLRAAAAGLGLPFGDRKMTYNTRLAQEVGLWAETRGKGHEFHNAAFKAYFVQGWNLALREVILDLMASVCLDMEEGARVIDQRSFGPAVDRDWSLSREKGITAVPSFIMGKDRLVGARPYPVLENLVREHLDPFRQSHAGL